MEKTGLIIGIIKAVNDIADGRIGLRTKGKTEEGRENLAKGLELAKQIFSEVKYSDDPELMLLAEYSFINFIENQKCYFKKFAEKISQTLLSVFHFIV